MKNKITLKETSKHERPWIESFKEGDNHRFVWYREGKEVSIQTSLHGVIELGKEFVSNGYKWK